MSNNWIFLRGLTRGKIHWGDFPDLFLAANPGAQVEYLEIPGNGSLAANQTPVDPEIVVDFLKSKSRLVQSNGPYHLCGISLGGMVALKWAQLDSAKIESVNVINSSLSQYSAFYQRLRPGNYLPLLSAMFNHSSFEQEKIILKITSNKFEQNIKYLKAYAQFAADHKVSRANFFRQLMLANNIQLPPIPNLRLNVFSAAQDRLVHPSCSQQIASSLKGKLIIHPSAGHDLPLDEPEWLIEQLMNNTN